MIKLRIYSKQEYIDTHMFPANGARKPEHLYVTDNYYTSFWHVMCPTLLDDDEAGKPPFRDAESVQFLKNSYDVVFADDEDWYSVICEGTRMNIACLNKAIICGLGMIYDSKRGLYSWLTSMTENVWRALGSLPMDVLVAVREDFLSEWHSFFCEADFTIVNYPLGDSTVEVKAVRACIYGNDFYTKVPNSSLCVGKDGLYYMESMDLHGVFEYDWKEDIKGILNHIRFKWGNLKRLEEFSHTYDVFELGKLLNNDENSIMDLEYPHLLRCVKPDENDAEAMQKYHRFVKELQESDDYNEYLYFRDTFRIVNHMFYIPKIYSRRLVMLMVDRAGDGSYKIHYDLTMKNPNFSELIYEAVSHRIDAGERFILMIDVDEVIRSCDAIDHAVCGFKAVSDYIEVFDKESGIKLFRELLEEAYASGKCTMTAI